MIYNQGFEITINQRIYFAYSNFTEVRINLMLLFHTFHVHV